MILEKFLSSLLFNTQEVCPQAIFMCIDGRGVKPVGQSSSSRLWLPSLLLEVIARVGPMWSRSHLAGSGVDKAGNGGWLKIQQRQSIFSPLHTFRMVKQLCCVHGNQLAKFPGKHASRGAEFTSYHIHYLSWQYEHWGKINALFNAFQIFLINPSTQFD